jgi:hypothetical protein
MGATCLVTLDGSDRSEGLRAQPRPRTQLYALEITPCPRDGARIEPMDLANMRVALGAVRLREAALGDARNSAP